MRITSVRADDSSKVRLTVVTDAPTTRVPVVRENNRPVAGLAAENLGRGKSVVLAVDRSQSMQGKALADASAAARAFVGAKAPADRIAIVTVGHRALQLSRFTSATIDADTTLRSIETDATRGTALYDAVVLSAEALAAEPHSGRVLIVLTDGQEVSSEASLGEAIAAAKEARVTVHPIGILSPAFRPGPLRRLAGETGGRYHAAASSAELRSIYAAIAAELRRTWQLEYLTNAPAGKTRSVTVAVPRQGTAASTFTALGTASGGERQPPAEELLPHDGAGRSRSRSSSPASCSWAASSSSWARAARGCAAASSRTSRPTRSSGRRASSRRGWPPRPSSSVPPSARSGTRGRGRRSSGSSSAPRCRSAPSS